MKIVPISHRARKIWIAPFGSPNVFITARTRKSLTISGYAGIHCITLIPTRKIK